MPPHIKRSRLPGEVAFDRCFLPLAALFVLTVAAAIIVELLQPPYKALTEAQLAARLPAPAWHAWWPFALGLVLAAFWVRGFVTLFNAWTDPSAKVLRFAAAALLVGLSVITWLLLFAPFESS